MKLATVITLESFQLVGTLPDNRDMLNEKMDIEQALSIWVDMTSGPEADFTLSDWMIETTSSPKQEIAGKLSFQVGGFLAVPWGVEKQEVKNELSRLALAGVLSAVH